MKKRLMVFTVVLAALGLIVFSGCKGDSGSAGPQGPAGPGITWVDVTGTSVQAEPNTGYMADSSSQVTITLPASLAFGDIIQVSGVGGGGWKIAQNAGQSVTRLASTTYGGQIYLSDQSTTPGTAGSISGGQYEAIALQYIGNNTFTVLSHEGSLTVQ